MRSPSAKLHFSILSLTLAMLAAGAARAATIHVPADQPTIQAAINAAANGDTVLVAPGTYFENINFKGKAITVTSSGGPSVTTINGGGVATVVMFINHEGRDSVLSGFTITNGYTLTNYQTLGVGDYDGGGIYINSASPTISGNVVTGNRGCGNGGGIAAESSSALIQGNTITNNSQGSCSGGNGGGLYLSGAGSPQIVGNTISNNLWRSGWGGGVAMMYSANPTLQNNLISGNTSTGISPMNRGGGIYIYDSFPRIIQNLITGNAAGLPGEAAAGQGGGIYFQSGSSSGGLLLVNNTLANNSGTAGSGIYADNTNSQADFINNLVVAAAGQPAVYCATSAWDVQPDVQDTDAFSSGGNGFDGLCAGLAGSNGNLSVDPLFLDPAGNFHFENGSPAIDAGSSTAPALPSTDLDGLPRILDGNNDGTAIVDVGAYEFTPTSDTVSPSSLSFADQDLGSTSAAQIVTVTNTGNQNLFLSISADHNFGEADNCFAPVSPGGSCVISVTFTPAVVGALSGNLTLRSNAQGSPQTVSLTGTSLGPVVSLTPTSLSFGSVNVGSSSEPQTVTLQNTGNAMLNISGIAWPSDSYSATNDCGATVAAGASCTITITFTPTAPGYHYGDLTITDNAAYSPQDVFLLGLGVTAGFSVTPASLNFSNQTVGTTHVGQIVTLQNGGSTPVTIYTVNISTLSSVPPGTFWYMNACGSTLAANSNCTITVYFSPKAAGAWTGYLLVYDSATGSPHSVALSGNGIPPVAQLSPSSLAFGPQAVGTTSPPQTITLTNTGSVPLGISSIYAPSPFAQGNNCGTSVGPGASCLISVTFTPSLAGTTYGSLTITDSVDGAISLSLSGVAAVPTATLSPASLVFGGTNVGTTSAPQSTNLTNTGTVPLSISSITAAGDFAQTNNCGASLAAGASCTINVTFTPTAANYRSGALWIASNGTVSPQPGALSGTGIAAMASLSPASLSFGSQVVGTTSPALAASLSNTGGAALTISGINITGDFAQTSNCGVTLAPGANCSFSITFIPAATGPRAGSLTVSSNSQGGPVSVALSGNGTDYAPTFNPTSLVFSNQIVGTKSGGKNIKLTANGPGPLVISSISVTGNFLESSNCPASLNKGQSCNITINFQPTMGGPAAGTIIVTDNGLGSPQLVPVSGNGLDFTLTASPSSVSVNAGQAAQYTVTATEVGGTFNNKINLACSGLPAGAKCQFSPSGITPKTGSASSALSVSTTAGGSGTPPGSYSITIIGTSGSLQHAAAVTLVVN